MRAKYDLEPIELTDRFVHALKELMAAKCDMMQRNEPEFADNWTWGRCTINDLAHKKGLEFEFGSDEDFPQDDLGRFAVVEMSKINIPPRYIIKMTDCEYMSHFGYNASKELIIHTTGDMELAKTYTKRGAKMMLTKLGGVEIEQFVRPELTVDELAELEELIIEY